MRAYDIATLVISILSLVSSGVISFAIFYMGERMDIKRNRLDVEYMARKFIIDHGDEEIMFLPYCVIASGVNRHHKHIRSIYNDFDALPDDVQKEVLRQAKYDYSLIKESTWVDAGLKEIKDFAKHYGFGDTFLYEGEKYFRRAFDDHSEALTSKYNELEDLFNDSLGWQPKHLKTLKGTRKISFSQYMESYYQAFVLGKNEKGFKKEDVPKPLDYLKEAKNFPNCDQEEICFWMMVSVRKLATYVERTRHGGYMDGIQIHGIIDRGDALPETFEDMYYETLMALYELWLDEEYPRKYKKR